MQGYAMADEQDAMASRIMRMWGLVLRKILLRL